jgi:hypothetical protein
MSEFKWVIIFDVTYQEAGTAKELSFDTLAEALSHYDRQESAKGEMVTRRAVLSK